MRDETLALHAGFDADPATRAVVVPIYQTVAYQFDSADQGAALFNLEEEGYRYSRVANPTVAVLEARVAALEGAAGALATASGQALGLIKRLVNIGDAKSLACHPASITHRQMPLPEQRKAGLTPETIRRSIGIEHRDDIIADLDQALAAAAHAQWKVAQ
jgi:O-acetylhomoserine/O-acetylserine sulfhydrylase-like pyridoxal-dependent enzyme